MKKHFGQWDIEEQGNQHRYDQHRSEAFEDISTHREENECYQSRTELTISDSWSTSLFRIVDGSSHTFSFLELFAHSFIDKDICIYSHSDRKNNDCDTRK